MFFVGCSVCTVFCSLKFPFRTHGASCSSVSHRQQVSDNSCFSSAKLIICTATIRLTCSSKLYPILKTVESVNEDEIPILLFL